MGTSFYSTDELKEIGFQAVGEDVSISRNVRIYGASNMKIGNHVRIDDFCVLSGVIELEDYIHIAFYSGLFAGSAGIKMESFSTLSSKCIVYAHSDDYLGNFLTNPTVDEEFRGPVKEKVILGRHVIIGTGSTILPGVKIGEGCAVGSMSLVKSDLDEWGIYAGIPCKRKKECSRKLLELEKEFLDLRGKKEL